MAFELCLFAFIKSLLYQTKRVLIFISSGNVSRKDGIEKFDSPVRGGRNKEKTANVSMSGGGDWVLCIQLIS